MDDLAEWPGSASNRLLLDRVEALRVSLAIYAFELAVRAGILTPDGRLAPPYRPGAEPSACRPTD